MSLSTGVHDSSCKLMKAILGLAICLHLVDDLLRYTAPRGSRPIPHDTLPTASARIPHDRADQEQFLRAVCRVRKGRLATQTALLGSNAQRTQSLPHSMGEEPAALPALRISRLTHSRSGLLQRTQIQSDGASTNGEHATPRVLSASSLARFSVVGRARCCSARFHSIANREALGTGLDHRVLLLRPGSENRGAPHLPRSRRLTFGQEHRAIRLRRMGSHS
jgi:hypothetical protein